MLKEKTLAPLKVLDPPSAAVAQTQARQYALAVAVVGLVLVTALALLKEAWVARRRLSLPGQP